MINEMIATQYMWDMLILIVFPAAIIAVVVVMMAIGFIDVVKDRFFKGRG